MKAVLLALAALTLFLQGDPGETLARNGDLPGAEREYRRLLAENPTDPTLNYNLGTVLLFDGRFDEARPYLERATADSAMTGPTRYNLGNTDLQPAFDDGDLPERNERLRRAIDAYRTALITDPSDEDARWNLEIATRLLERDSPPPSGGGGGGGGGTGQGPPNPGDNQPSPAPADGPGPEPDVAREEAEELLDSAREREMELQKESLRKPWTDGVRP